MTKQYLTIIIAFSVLFIVINPLNIESKNPNQSNLTAEIYFIYDTGFPVDNYKNYTLFEPIKDYYFNNSMSLLPQTAVYMQLENTGEDIDSLRANPAFWGAYGEDFKQVKLIYNVYWMKMFFVNIPEHESVIIDNKDLRHLISFPKGEKVGLFLLLDLDYFKKMDILPEFYPMFEFRGVIKFNDGYGNIIEKIPFKDYYLIP